MNPHPRATQFALDPLFPRVSAAFCGASVCRLKPLPFSAAALLALEMRRLFNASVVLVTESPRRMDEMRRNLAAFAGDRDGAILDFPPLENAADTRPDPAASGERLRTLAHVCAGGNQFLVNTCIQALMQETISPEILRERSMILKAGQACNPEELAGWLERSGYEFVPQVQEAGRATRRGGLMDLWPPSESCPVRVEFNGMEIETIRSFDPADQRSFEPKESVFIPPASEINQSKAAHGGDPCGSLAARLPPATVFFWIEMHVPPAAADVRQVGGIAGHAEIFSGLRNGQKRPAVIPLEDLLRKVAGRGYRHCCSVLQDFLPLGFPGSSPPSQGGAIGEALVDLGFRPIESGAASSRPFLTPDVAHEIRARRMAALEERALSGTAVHFFFATPGALERFRETHHDAHFHLHLGAISDGFIHEELKMAVAPEQGLASAPKIMRRHSEVSGRRAPVGAEWESGWADFEPGDLVVHAGHGIGKFIGLQEIVFNNRLQETVAIEYADSAKLYVPVSQLHLISRYTTVGGRRMKVHRLGGTRWQKEKESAQKSIHGLAASLLETQALRKTLAGFAFPPDSPWQRDFEAAFPYEETEDQERAIAEIKSDMESTVPMDRLVCGDAGYGKTEVAMRAVFKAVASGKQAVLLAPTTVLALQHYEVFQQRMESYPVRVELLCRFRSHAEQARVVADMRLGKVDIAIGTHRLLQPDIGFKDLGLIVIDEEQRFGVVHKERLKHFKSLADVLVMTATPIPRTLYMSLTGARTISMIQTPPKARRPIETIVATNDDRLVRDAILREVNRGGQAYYLHNRVATIEKAAERLKMLAPEARIVVAHGQMAPRDLADRMHAFARGEFDVLLCTTIVESGVDIPNANTILIDRADRFGIADLYQLRGRVGRADRKAYAYLLTPVHGRVLDISRRRLRALMEHDSSGAGFRLAMMDLEIRGAGNLLGTEQSGHIAAIGFDLYCRLLRRAVERVKSGGEATGISLVPEDSMSCAAPAPEVDLDFIGLAERDGSAEAGAFLPAAYVEDEPVRISVYRRIALAASPAEIEALRAEFRDRFGPLPQPFERFLKIASIRALANSRKFSAVECRRGKLMLKRGGDYVQSGNRFPRLRASDVDGRLDEIIRRLSECPMPGLRTE